MLSMLPLLVADPSLPAEVRRALAGPQEEAVRALLSMGVSCKDAVELTWREASYDAAPCAQA
jgi:hypothetical protein